MLMSDSASYGNLEKLQYLLHNPATPNEEIETVFLELMGEELIDTGREYFRKKGRGVLLFDLRGIAGWRRGDMPTLYYLTLQEYQEAGGDEEYLEDDINDYNPQEEALVLFVYDYSRSGRVVSKRWDLRGS